MFGNSRRHIHMDSSLINSFRNQVNQHSLILHIYRNFNGKNKWNAICSAMDWIQVGISGIDKTKLKRDNSDEASIRFMTFVSCIDVMWEGVQQLHRVFFGENGIPFGEQHKIFQQDMDDNHYWKEIRAAFAAHPTNLGGTKEGEKRFASWSGGGFGNDGDFSVLIYSNDPNQTGSTFFDIKFDELIQFASSRYEYLYTIMDQIDKITAQWCEKWKNTPITLFNDVKRDVDILLQENKIRLNNDYYQERLEEIERAFSIEPASMKNKKLISEYRDALLYEIKEITYALQSMNLDYEYEPLDDSVDFYYDYPNQHLFEPEKGLLSWAISKLKTPLGCFIDFDSYDNLTELQTLVNAGWWKYNQIVNPCDNIAPQLNSNLNNE